ncbi:MAG: adenylate/guanylate cyclase domain-containing protein [Leptospiraceae bacterium]|nr:adenylate/guanylate cyclase domain-containing protein [Leptospiraceae bacterium]MCP5501613.1 adenylate/guanylate cyclase domain-containing protein [Leptospiraceae bacterium]
MQISGGLWISFVITVLMIAVSNSSEPFHNLEENSISWRFYYSKNEDGRRVRTNDKGEVQYTVYNPPAEARSDIQIIGLTTESIENLSGKWPIPWKYYMNIIDVFSKTDNAVLMFDVFFLDEKPEQVDLEAAIRRNKEVYVDFPMYSSSEIKEEIKHYDERLKEYQKFRLKNVVDPGNRGKVFVRFPHLPIGPVMRSVAGAGFANILKETTNINRTMPLYAKIPVENGFEYYPSIDLLVACGYYDVDVVKDTEIVVGKYVKIKNIPNKKIETFNMKTLQVESKDIMTRPNPERTITIPIDDYGRMQINFAGGRNSFRVHHFHEVAKDWDTETPINNRMENTIFLVAMYYATGLDTAKDQHYSPFGEISGVEHHAHTLNTILNQDFLFSTKFYTNVLIYLCMGLFIGLVQPRLKTWFAFIFINLLVLGFVGFAFYSFKNMHLIIPFPTVVLEQILIFVSLIGFKIFGEEANVKYIKNTFSKFVSSDVVDELLKDPSKIALGGSKKEITIFFSDIRGFTTISESLGPEQLVSLLNEYLSAMTEIVLAYKGTIDKYMGDAIMAFWGAPMQLEDHAYYACVTALYQMEHLKKMQEDWKTRGLPSIDIGIGLNTGLAVVGNMGSAHRMEYTCMGDTINLGSRLEGSNKMYATNIIISEYTYEKVKDRVYARELDLVKVKGKNFPVRIYELIGLVDDKDYEKMKRHLKLQ